MAIQASATLRNALLDAVESTIGVSAVLKIRSGAAPADCAAADSGDVLATLSLPEDWMNAANAGSKTLKGTWQDASADDDGTAGHFRIYAADGVTCHMQGTVTLPGDGGDMTLVNTNIAAGQTVNITTFTLNAAYA